MKTYVLLAKDQATSSLAARQKVVEELSKDPTFFSGNGRFGTPICDGFFVGGKYSGHLYPQKMRDEFLCQVDQLASSKDRGRSGYTSEFIQNNCEKMEEIWQKLGGKYKCPLTRPFNSKLDAEDDACLLSQEIAEDLNIYLQEDEYIRETYGIFDISGYLFVIDLYGEMAYDLKRFEDIAGQFWVVLIDYCS